MAWVGLVLAGVSTAMNIQAEGEREDAIRQSNLASANTLERKAKEVVAAGQRDMLEERKRKELVASRAQAVAAAGGGDASDPAIMNLIADIEAEGVYREQVALYNAEAEAQSMREEARLLRLGVRQVESATRTRQAAHALEGASSIYDQYSRAYPSGGDGFATTAGESSAGVVSGAGSGGYGAGNPAKPKRLYG